MHATVLGKYEVGYYCCSVCDFIQTEDPYWLSEAYSSAIANLDIGLIHRNEISSGIVQTIISKWFDKTGQFIDYGGGYGMLVRMMRDRGYNFFRYDIHCENLFAKSFEASLLENSKQPYELLTAFEVFEHLVDPVNDLKQMLSYSRNILFSTELQPEHKPITLDNWWYILPETGQHISLYAKKTLKVLAEINNLYVYNGENNMHLLTDRKINPKLFTWLTNWRGSIIYNLASKSRQPSLLDSDLALLRYNRDPK